MEFVGMLSGGWWEAAWRVWIGFLSKGFLTLRMSKLFCVLPGLMLD